MAIERVERLAKEDVILRNMRQLGFTNLTLAWLGLAIEDTKDA